MTRKGFLKGGERKEKNWKKAQTYLREPFKKAIETFKTQVMDRKDFEPSSLLQFGLFMSQGIINILKEAERELGEKGQEIVITALRKTGYQIGQQMIDPEKIPEDVSDIELMSFLATIINTQAWTSIEDPRIDSEEQCSFDILWCPLQDVYSAFDCRVQRYLVQGIIDYFRDKVFRKSDFQIEFTQTIPAGAECCTFVIREKDPGEEDKWENYSKRLAKKALHNSKD
jgi:predicted hydrocarbon binding protein